MKTPIAILFFGALQLGAATYYVDYVAGDNSNNGTTTSTPWQHHPDDTSASGTAAGTTISAGDTVIFKGGVTYEGQIRATDTGSAGNPITYISGDMVGWGSGPAIMDGTSVSAALWTSTYRGMFNVPSFCNVVGITLTNVAGGNAAYGGMFFSGSDNVVSNCVVAGGSGGASGVNGFAIYKGVANPGSNYTFIGCVAITNAWHGYFVVGPVQNVYFTNCHAADNGNESGTYADGWFIGDNSFGFPTNVVLSECTASNHPQKGGMIFEPAVNVIMDRCTITGTNAFGISVGNTQYSTAIGSNLTIRNCVIDVSTSTAGAPLQIKSSNNAYTNGLKDIKLLNNTLRLRKGAGNTGVIWIQTQTTTFVEGVYATNNVICVGSNTVTLVNIDSETTNIFFDQNLYWTNTPAKVNVEFVTNGTNTTPVNWFNQHDATTTLRSLTNNAGLDDSFYPLVGSPVIDNGADSGLAVDRAGVSRPQGSAFDIGAFEFVGFTVNGHGAGGYRPRVTLRR